MRLQGKRVVVTGSSMGIGQAVAIKLAEEGAKVVVNARGLPALEETVRRIRDKGGTVTASSGSVADYGYAGQLIQTCVDEYGGIDVLINCAGIAEPKGASILNISSEDWKNILDIHLTGTFNTCRHAAPIMAKQRHGTIINTSSHGALGLYGGTAYVAGKGGTNSLTMAIAMDLKEHGINVNAVCPGAKTRLSSGEDYEEYMRSLNRRGLLSDELMNRSLNPPSPDQVAPLYAYLASDAARNITGRLFWGAGGYVGLLHKNPDELLAMRDHESSPPWTLPELEKKLNRGELERPDNLFNVILKSSSFRLLIKQEILLKMENSKMVKALQSYAKRKKGPNPSDGQTGKG